MNQVYVPYRPSYIALVAGIIVFAGASYGLAISAPLTDHGISFSRVIDMSVDDVAMLKRAGSMIGGAMAVLCMMALAVVLVRRQSLVLTESDVTIPSGLFADAVMVPFSSITSLRIRPSKGQDFLEVTHHDGTARIDGSMLRRPYTLASLQRLLREKVESVPKTAAGRRRRNPSAPYVFNPKQAEMGFAPRAFGQRQDF